METFIARQPNGLLTSIAGSLSKQKEENEDSAEDVSD